MREVTVVLTLTESEDNRRKGLDLSDGLGGLVGTQLSDELGNEAEVFSVRPLA